jgi:hypothetical protein
LRPEKCRKEENRSNIGLTIGMIFLKSTKKIQSTEQERI